MLKKETKKFSKDYSPSLLIEVPKDKPIDWATNMTHFEKDKSNFHVMAHLECHEVRRAKILKAHPEIEKLADEKDPISIVVVLIINFLQLIICYLISKHIESLFYLLILAYFVGAILNHGLFIMMHDITHFTCFKSPFYNKLLAIFSNLPQVLPSAISFGRYHKDHHTFQGDELLDPDIPTKLEIYLFNNSYTKLLFLVTMPVFYAFRPYLKKPKVQNSFELFNIVACLIYNFFIVKYFGWNALLYLLLGTLWGLSINPVGMHVIAEHYEFNKGQDTFSYYGWMNYLNFNVGYHIEHHDFPTCSWRNLPKIRKIAPEFYDNLPQIESYFTVMYKYIFDDDIGPYSRIVREVDNCDESIEEKEKKLA